MEPSDGPFEESGPHLYVGFLKPTANRIIRTVVSLPADIPLSADDYVYQLSGAVRILITDPVGTTQAYWAVRADAVKRMNGIAAERTGLWRPSVALDAPVDLPAPRDTPARGERKESAKAQATAVVQRHFYDEPRRVREMLTCLASALGCITSPAARLLALQCALRASTDGCARLPTGMRLHRRTEVRQEPAVDDRLDLPVTWAAFMHVRLPDDAILDQAPGRSARRRAAHRALRPSPLPTPLAAELAERLAAPVPAAHTDSSGTAADLTVVARPCGHSRQQTGELLDRPVARHTLQPGAINRTPTRCSGSPGRVTDSLYVLHTILRPDPSQPYGRDGHGYLPYYRYSKACAPATAAAPRAAGGEAMILRLRVRHGLAAHRLRHPGRG